MCGIIGYNGELLAPPFLIDGLSRLEYRGYDSAGIAIKDENQIQLIKKAGKVSVLQNAIAPLELKGSCGIGHTRWATHGGVSDSNAHPHRAGHVVLIHNGIIENFRELIKKYQLQGQLSSQTDTEVAAAVFNYFYHGDPKQAIRDAVSEMVGSFAFCIMFDDQPDLIYAVRNVSPMVATCCDQGALIASDITALIPYTNRYFVVPEYHLVTLGKDYIQIETMDGASTVEPEYLEVAWNIQSAQKGGYKFFMMKEIMEQPEVIANTISPRIAAGLPSLLDDQVPDSVFENIQKIQIVACGTAMHAGMVFKSMVESLMRIPVDVAVASEYRYNDPIIDEKTLVIAISQSGETIDTLEALRLSKQCGATTLSVVNVKGSTIARESDYVVYTHAGPEIAVASTKAYTVQIATLYLIGCKIGLVQKRISEEQARDFILHLQNVPQDIQKVLAKKDSISETVVDVLKNAENAFFIGRGNDYSLSLEGALKLKEISYIHAEAYAAGELKHGTIALITEGVPVIAIATQRKVLSKMLSNIEEVTARGASVILITEENTQVSEKAYKIHLTIPETEDVFSVFPTSAYLQLIAYYASDSRGLDVDMPRNLAKSVTVE